MQWMKAWIHLVGLKRGQRVRPFKWKNGLREKEWKQEKKKKKKIKWELEKKQWRLWQPRPRTETNLRQRRCTSAAVDHPRRCWVSSTLSYHQTVPRHDVTGQRPVLPLPDRPNQWRRSKVALKQMEHDVMHTHRLTRTHGMRAWRMDSAGEELKWSFLFYQS